MATVREMKRTIKAVDTFKTAKQSYLDARAELFNDDEHDADAIVAKIRTASDKMIDAAISMAKLSGKAFGYAVTLENLRERAKSSNAIRERLVNAILETKVS